MLRQPVSQGAGHLGVERASARVPTGSCQINPAPSPPGASQNHRGPLALGDGGGVGEVHVAHAVLLDVPGDLGRDLLGLAHHGAWSRICGEEQNRHL